MSSICLTMQRANHALHPAASFLALGNEVFTQSQRSNEPPSRWAVGQFGTISTRLLQSPGSSGAGRWSFGGGIATWRFLLDVYKSMTTFFRSQQD
jgi:hypothetical protein